MRPSRLPPPPEVSRRRAAALLGSVVALGLGGVVTVLAWPEAPPRPVRLGPRRLVLPLIREADDGLDIVYALTRRTERDPADPPDALPGSERFELLAFAGPSFVPVFEVPLAAVPVDAAITPELLAMQGDLLWIWIGGIGAVSARDGQVLADQGLIAARNPGARIAGATSRRDWGVTDALVFDPHSLGRGLRIDTASFLGSPAAEPPPRPLPLLFRPATVGRGGPTGFRIIEARLDDTWFGLPAVRERLVGPLRAPATTNRFIPAPALPDGLMQRLWRGRIRPTSGAPPGWPEGLGGNWRPVEALTDLVPMTELPPLHRAGFLTAGTAEPVRIEAPPGLLLLHEGPGDALRLTAVANDGRPRWETSLPFSTLRSVLPGREHLVLLGEAAGGQGWEAVLASVMLADGMVEALRFAA